ncbi:hypothetical protein C457_13504 [Haloferax prahovense DSM 18310]|uniref:Uncharacterized protein n=1 Tax=Haloferax prahovense (strain DSM 18310 / JCM 13924 / TL6) TaxID=1227461 RepID=M0G468_HALPT|nr:hypothetical protein [Haloferax prahovense]ELZ67056.1 hypothetical protein C457_13504 [Haloferax prahovense DSM 18310]
MSQIINSKLYETTSAEMIADYCPLPAHTEYDYLHEVLFETPKGNYFLYREGAPKAEFGILEDTDGTFGMDIEPLSEQEASEWCQDRRVETETILDNFGHLIERA